MGRQGGDQVGALGHVQRHLAGPAQLHRVGYDAPVPLGGVGVEAQDLHLAAQAVGGVVEGGLGIVALHCGAAGAVGLPAGNPEGAPVGALRPDAEALQGLQGHVHVAPGLQRSGQRDLGVPLQQGQGIEQTGDELGGDIPRQGEGSRRQHAPDGEDAVLLPVSDPLLVKEIEVGLLGPFHEPPPSGKAPAAPQGQGHRDEEPKRGARFAAVQDGQALSRRLQCGHAAAGGLDVLGVRQIFDPALPVRQGGGNEQPVGLGLGGGRRDGPLEQAGCDGHIHSAQPSSSPSSSRLDIRCRTALPRSSRRTRVIWSPAPFLSRPMAAA